MPSEHPQFGSSCRKAGLVHKFKKIRFNSNSRNQIFGYIFVLRVGLGFPTYHVKPCHAYPGMFMSLCKHGFNGEDNTFGLSTHKVTPMVSEIHCRIHRDHLQWWTNLSILNDSPLLQKEHSLLPLTDASLKGWGAHVKHQTASGLWNQEESRLLITF